MKLCLVEGIYSWSEGQDSAQVPEVQISGEREAARQIPDQS